MDLLQAIFGYRTRRFASALAGMVMVVLTSGCATEATQIASVESGAKPGS